MQHDLKLVAKTQDVDMTNFDKFVSFAVEHSRTFGITTEGQIHYVSTGNSERLVAAFKSCCSNPDNVV